MLFDSTVATSDNQGGKFDAGCSLLLGQGVKQNIWKDRRRTSSEWGFFINIFTTQILSQCIKIIFRACV